MDDFELSICYCHTRDFIKNSVFKISVMSVTYLFYNSRFSDVTRNYSFIAALYILCVTVTMLSLCRL